MKFSSRLFLLCYYIVTFFLAPIGLIYLCHKKRRDPPYGRRVFELLGIHKLAFKRCIWFHTVSVGEAIAARPLIKAFVRRHPQLSVIVTTTTTTGAREVAKIEGVTHVFAPLDSPLAVFLFLRSFKPSHLFIMETELWPGMLNITKSFGTKICVFNARMPEKTCTKYEKRNGLTSDIIASRLDLVIAQTKDDAERFERIGVPKEKVLVSGSLKYDLHPNEHLFQEARLIKRSWYNTSMSIGAISTHDGEEEMVIEAFYNLRNLYPDLRLILVPRHKSGVEKAVTFLENISASYSLRTNTDRNLIGFDKEVFVGDTMGEIEFYLGLCDLVFMGGSLVDVGGHNPLEPAYFALPIITGPYYYNFAEQYETLIENSGAYVANDYQRLFNVCRLFIESKELLNEFGMRAMDTQLKGRGALEFTLDKLEGLLAKVND